MGEMKNMSVTPPRPDFMESHDLIIKKILFLLKVFGFRYISMANCETSLKTDGKENTDLAFEQT